MKPVTLASVTALIRFSGGVVRNLRILNPAHTFANSVFRKEDGKSVVGFKNHGNMHLGQVFKNLEKLEMLKLNGLGRPSYLFEIPNFPAKTLRHVVIREHLNILHLMHICHTADGLQYLECSFQIREVGIPQTAVYPSVKVLKIVELVLFVSGEHFHKVLDWFPNVEEFHFRKPLGGLRELKVAWKSLKVARISGARDLLGLIVLSEELTNFELKHLPSLFQIDIRTQQCLQELSLTNVPRAFQDLRLFQSADNAKTLNKLTISSTQFEVRDVEPFFSGGTGLNYVNIDGLRYVNDATLAHLYSHTLLEQLEINDCTGVTGHGIIKLIEKLSVKKGGRLRWVSVRGNESIRRQTIDWARGLGVMIVI
jgi:hypothetical protein